MFRGLMPFMIIRIAFFIAAQNYSENNQVKGENVKCEFVISEWNADVKRCWFEKFYNRNGFIFLERNNVGKEFGFKCKIH